MSMMIAVIIMITLVMITIIVIITIIIDIMNIGLYLKTKNNTIDYNDNNDSHAPSSS